MAQYPSTMPALERRLSIEQTYELAATARRKSSSQLARSQLRMQLGHAHMIEALEYAIRTSPPPSPKQRSHTPQQSSSTSYQPLSLSSSSPKSSSSSSASSSIATSQPEYDEYGFAYDDEDMESLSLCRTQSRR